MLRCPSCFTEIQNEITFSEDFKCRSCGKTFPSRQGFLSFETLEGTDNSYAKVGDDLEFLEQEDATARSRFIKYFVPLFKQRRIGPDTAVLCLGCGGGSDVATLAENGFVNTYGVDTGWRSEWWRRKGRNKNRMFIVDGVHLPFEDSSFGIIIALGVIEHVGAVGATAELFDDYEKRRLQFVAETMRVLKKGGSLIVACPNRLFPIDFQHNISRAKLFKKIGETTGLSFHSVFNRFLLSRGDLVRLCSKVPCGTKISVMPISGYLGLGFRNSRFLRSFSRIFDSYLALLDRLPVIVRTSCANPYLICQITKVSEPGND